MNGLRTRHQLRDASQEQADATRYGPSTIARWQAVVEAQRREIFLLKVTLVIAVGIVLGQWWGGR